MANPTTLIEDYIKNEESKMSWFDKVAMNYPKVRPTGFLIGSVKG